MLEHSDGVCEICFRRLDNCNNYAICASCTRLLQRAQELGVRLADNVYACKYGDNKGHDNIGGWMFDYKNSSLPAERRENAVRQVAGICAEGLNAININNFDAIAVVPSSKGRTALENMVSCLVSGELFPVQYSGTPVGRELSPDSFIMEAPVPNNILVVEDSWVSGATAQSLAACLHNRGANKVDILVLARLQPTG